MTGNEEKNKGHDASKNTGGTKRGVNGGPGEERDWGPVQRGREKQGSRCSSKTSRGGRKTRIAQRQREAQGKREKGKGR